MQYKKYLTLIAMSACVLSLSACGKVTNDSETKPVETIVEETIDEVSKDVEQDSAKTSDTEKTEDVKESEDPYANNEYAKQALAFVEAITAKDFDNVHKMLDIDSPEFVTVDDVEKGLYSTKMKDLIGSVGSIEVTDVSEDYKKATVTVLFSDTPYTISVIEKDGNYVIPADGICVTDFTITAPRGVNVTLCGEDLTNYLTTSTGDITTYVIPQIGSTDKEAVLSCEGFDSVTTIVTPSSADCTLNLAITDEAKLQTYYDDYKVLMNNLFADAFNDTSVDALKPYFWSNATGEDIQTVVNYLTDKDGFSGCVKESGVVPTITLVDSRNAHYTSGNDNNLPDVRVFNGETGVIRMNIAIVKDYSRKDGFVYDHTCNLITCVDVIYEDGTMKLMPVYTGDNLCTKVYTKWPFSTSNEW